MKQGSLAVFIGLAAACGSLPGVPFEDLDAAPSDAEVVDAAVPDARPGAVVVELRDSFEPSTARVLVTDAEGSLLQDIVIEDGDSFYFEAVAGQIIHVGRFDAKGARLGLTTFYGVEPGTRLPVGPLESDGSSERVGDLVVSFEPIADASSYTVFTMCTSGASDGATIGLEVSPLCVDADGNVAGEVVAQNASGELFIAGFEVSAPDPATPVQVLVKGWQPYAPTTLTISPLPLLQFGPDPFLPLYFLSSGPDRFVLDRLLDFMVPPDLETLIFTLPMRGGFADAVGVGLLFTRVDNTMVTAQHQLFLRLDPLALPAQLEVSPQTELGPIKSFFDDTTGVIEWIEDPPPATPLYTMIRFDAWTVIGPGDLASPLHPELHDLADVYPGQFFFGPLVQRIYVEEGDSPTYPQLLRTYGADLSLGLMRESGWKRIVIRSDYPSGAPPGFFFFPF